LQRNDFVSIDVNRKDARIKHRQRVFNFVQGDMRERSIMVRIADRVATVAVIALTGGLMLIPLAVEYVKMELEERRWRKELQERRAKKLETL
jgi:hypothetical protein